MVGSVLHPFGHPRSAAPGRFRLVGAEIARELARRGHSLVLVARRKARLDELIHKGAVEDEDDAGTYQMVTRLTDVTDDVD